MNGLNEFSAEYLKTYKVKGYTEFLKFNGYLNKRYNSLWVFDYVFCFTLWFNYVIKDMFGGEWKQLGYGVDCSMKVPKLFKESKVQWFKTEADVNELIDKHSNILADLERDKIEKDIHKRLKSSSKVIYKS